MAPQCPLPFRVDALFLEQGPGIVVVVSCTELPQPRVYLCQPTMRDCVFERDRLSGGDEPEIVQEGATGGERNVGRRGESEGRWRERAREIRIWKKGKNCFVF